MQQFFNHVDLLSEEFQPEQVRPARGPQATIPRLVDVRGIALDKIGDFKELNPREPAVAIIDDVKNFPIKTSLSPLSLFIGFMYQLWQMLHDMQ